MSLGEAYETGRGLPQDDAKAARVYRNACEAGAPEACARIAAMLDEGRGAPADPTASALYAAKACDGGVFDACAAAGVARSLGQGVPRDDAHAASLFKRGCSGGSARACALLGLAHAYGRGVAKDDARAAELLRGACSGGDALSCRELAHLLSTALPPVRDDRAALDLFLRACEQGEVAACSSAGTLLASGAGAPPSPERAVVLWTRACDSGNAIGCTRLGLAHLKGRGVAKDVAKASQLLDKGCAAGSTSACNVLGIAHAFGDEVPRDNARAEALFRAACELGSATGCTRLGLCYLNRRTGGASYDFGIAQAATDCRRTALACEWLGGVPRETAAQAFKLLVESCDAEIPAACSSLARAIAGGRVPRTAAAPVMVDIQGHCERGKAVWCRRLAFWHEEGLSVPKSEGLARGFYKKACDGGDLRACGDLGRMLALGQGGARDVDAAIALLKRACDGGSEGAGACGNLGMIYINGGKPAEHELGAGLLERACAQGDGLACDRIGGFYAMGAKGFARQERRAADLLERACALGGYACDEARRLREKFGVDLSEPRPSGSPLGG